MFKIKVPENRYLRITIGVLFITPITLLLVYPLMVAETVIRELSRAYQNLNIMSSIKRNNTDSILALLKIWYK